MTLAAPLVVPAHPRPRRDMFGRQRVPSMRSQPGMIELRAPVFPVYGEELDFVLTEVRKKGCRRMIVDGREIDLSAEVELDASSVRNMDAVVDRFVISRKHEISETYLDHLHREIELLAESLPDRRRVSQYHWGGGTPTYQSVREMRALHEKLLAHFRLEPEAEVALEVDPRVTTREQMEALRDMGFNRISMGVQDFTPEVQRAVNRVQSVEQTRALVDYTRKLGYRGINFDLIYGLPHQRLETFANTIEHVIDCAPDRVAIFSYAHVPQQRPRHWSRG